MERLTIRSDICCEPENNIVYSNPNDPEGMYNILDLAECLYNGGEAEAGILLDISNRLAAYEDTGLTPEEVHQLKAKYEALESDKNVIESSHINAEMNLEAQQQEIDRLKELLADWKYNTKCDADHIAALTADKDEQAGRIMEQDTLLKESRDLFNAVRGILKDVGRLFQASQKQVAATATMAFIIIIDALNKKIDALLGGKEDA